MTNQNVVISDAKSGIGMAITVAMPSAVPKPPAPPIAVPRKKKPLKKLETGPRKSSLIDSMRASSPTRKPSTPLSEAEDQIRSSWVLHDRSALDKFDQIVNASRGKQIVMFLDYDGTLSPIVGDPDRAIMTKEMRNALKDVAKYFPTAIVTGRSRAKVCEFVKLSHLYYAGSHGMDIKGPAKGSSKDIKGNQGVLFQPAREFLPMINEVYKTLLEKTKSTPGAKVENKKFCVSVHYRCVEEKNWNALAEQVRSVLTDYPNLSMTHGRKVLEILPNIKWNKGNALQFLLESFGYANSEDVMPVYIGDDRSDEDAFQVLRDRGQGLGILVSKLPRETKASYSLQDPHEVMSFLQHLVEWKESQEQEH